MSHTTLSTARQAWDLTDFFASIDSPAYRDFRAALERDLNAALGEAQAAADLSAETVPAWTGLVGKYEQLGSRLAHARCWLGCLGAADATDEAVQTETASFSGVEAALVKLRAELMRGLRGGAEADFAALCAAPALADAGWALQRLRHEGRMQMPVALEGLAADLAVDGMNAWGRLYDTLTGRMTFEMTFPDGSRQTVGMARRRALMSDPDRRLREAAFHDGQKPFLEHEDSLAASLNAIAGTRHTLYQRRGTGHFLSAPLHDAAMSQATLDALLQAIHENIELPRRAVRLAARKQGTPGLHFFDLEAPQWPAADETPVAWPEACGIVHRAFSEAWPAFGSYFQEMLERGWIESAVRPGKRPGAFMTESPFINQERIYMTHADTVHDVVTLAHEAGHAWHSSLLRGVRPLARQYPMTLAETASNFGEMILLRSLLSDPALPAAQKAHLLDQEMLRASANLLNIPMRFEFERRFYEERRSGELPASRLKELMREAQRHLYGDTLLPGGEDPMFWASKMHFFITDVSFYNFPYVFGYLLSQALYARFEAEGPSFLPKYETFLQSTGRASCEDCVRETLGQDITKPEFWACGIQAMARPLAELEAVGF